MKNTKEKVAKVKSAVKNPLKVKLIAAMNKVLAENELNVSGKIEKTLRKSAKKIVKRTEKDFKK
jgi:hypothetical protein